MLYYLLYRLAGEKIYRVFTNSTYDKVSILYWFKLFVCADAFSLPHTKIYFLLRFPEMML